MNSFEIERISIIYLEQPISEEIERQPCDIMMLHMREVEAIW